MIENYKDPSPLVIGGKVFTSRLFVGTGKFRSNEVMEQAVVASGSQMVTVAMKRIDMANTLFPSKSALTPKTGNSLTPRTLT